MPVSVTLRDVAISLGLHPSTVSRALRRDPRISPETRQRVQACCLELGYQTNSAFSQLAYFRWKPGQIGKGVTIGYIDRGAPLAEIRTARIETLTDQAALLGYQLATFNRLDYAGSAKLQSALRARGITDIILGPVYEKDLTVELDWPKFICVQMMPGFYPLPLHSVVRDHFNSVILAWRKAVAYGYRRIGIILMNHPIPILDDFMRQAAATACQTQLFPDLAAIPIFYITPTDMRPKDFIPWVKEQKIDAVIAFNPLPYFILLQASFGSRIAFATLNPDQAIDVAGVMDTETACARESVNLLHLCRRSYQWGIPTQRIDHVVEPGWHDGNSMPRLNPKE